MAKHILMIIVLLTLWGVSSRVSYACSCNGSTMILKLKLLEGTATDIGPAWHTNYSGAIFIGKVIRIKKEKVGASGSSVFRVRVTFDVERFWKGITDREAVVYTSPVGNGSCGFPFRKGQRYLVFAGVIENRLTTSICSFTAESRYAANIVKGLALGEGNAPIKQPVSPDAKPNNGMHPTANSAAFIRETPWLMRCVRGG